MDELENLSNNNQSSQNNSSNENEKKEEKNHIIEWLRYKSKFVRFVASFTLILTFLSLIVFISYYYFTKILPYFWYWGFDPFNWKFILSFFAILFSFAFYAMPIALFFSFFQDLMSIYASEAEIEFNKKIKEFEDKQIKYQEKLENSDELFLIPLVTFSRIELEQYYKIGVSQTQKSYNYSILSMWIGFFIIILGVLLFYFPIKIGNTFFTDGNVKILVLISGVITELISVMFLWIYKNSVRNLTYFYNRQIFIHNTLLAYKISSSMESSDDAKKIIVQKILDFGFKMNKQDNQ